MGWLGWPRGSRGLPEGHPPDPAAGRHAPDAVQLHNRVITPRLQSSREVGTPSRVSTAGALARRPCSSTPASQKWRQRSRHSPGEPNPLAADADGVTGPEAGRAGDAAALPATDRLDEIPGLGREAA